MYNQHFYCVIMAGGIGSRFWPVSRESRPKQFLNFTRTGESFLRLAYERIAEIIPKENIYVTSLTRYRGLVMSDIPDLDETNLLLEPYNRNTAPCIAYSTYTLLKRDPKAVVVVIPADHVIDDWKQYQATILTGLRYASEQGGIITLGIIPTRPDSNFGYIQVAGSMTPDTPVKVKTFTEKPDRELAQVFMDTGEFLWNAGIFIARARTIVDELSRHAPEIAKLWKGWEDKLTTSDERDFIARIYTDMPRISIDYAVMEKSSEVMTIPATFGWADIGNWESFYEYLAQHDANGNAVKMRGKNLLKENRGTLVYSRRKDKLVAVSGLENFIVIDTDDVLMICPRDESKLKEFLSELAMPEYEEYR